MIYDGKKISIYSYLKQLEGYIQSIKIPFNTEKDLLDDNKYEQCECGNPNEFFCEDCKKNICDKCKDYCFYSKNHKKLKRLNELKDSINENIDFIKKTLEYSILPRKKEEVNTANEININNKINNNIEEKEIIKNDSFISEEKDDNYDFFLIYKIISIIYNNYFHYKNIEGIKKYCIDHNYFFNIVVYFEYEGYGKRIYNDGKYYEGEFKKGEKDGKGIIYYKNGQIRYKGDFKDGEFEGYGIYVVENGEYYMGEFKKGLMNGKGILYYKNGQIKYEGDWVDGNSEGYGKNIVESGDY